MLADLLSDKERRFCEEYAVDFDRKRAMIAAGYSGENLNQMAWQVLQRSHVEEYLQFLKSEQSHRTKINADYVLKTIVETMERCSQEIEPFRDRTGRHVEVETKDGEYAKAYVFDARGVLKGAELLGKHLKIFTDVSEQKHTFTQMPSVLVGTAKINEQTGEQEMTALVFNVGSDANVPIK